jgi:(S)-ureidoglycine aminohydrolase
MRSPNELLHTRTRVRSRYALMPLEGFPLSRLPGWPAAEVRVLASPALGANFVQFMIDLSPGTQGEYPSDDRTETFIYILDGEAVLRSGGDEHTLARGGYALVPHQRGLRLRASHPTRLLLLRKLYEPAAGLEAAPLLVGNERDIPNEVYMGNEHARLQTLLPNEMSFDIAMNIFTFAPGHSLPVVETHVMEHGLYFLQGKGLYYLDNEWMEVRQDDFIWMGPYCPQSFYATGPATSKYIYYKNVNRDVVL